MSPGSRQITAIVLAFSAIAGSSCSAARSAAAKSTYVEPKQIRNAPLTSAVSRGTPADVTVFLDRGADVNDDDGIDTLLMIAVGEKNNPVARLLIDRGADVNKTARVGKQTPLMWAAASGNSEMFSELIARGADIHATDLDESDLMHYATEGGVEMIRRVLGMGFDVNRGNKHGETPLITAALIGDIDVVRELVAKGANVNAKNSNGRTALMTAGEFSVLSAAIETARSYAVVTRELLRQGADVNAKDKQGRTALDMVFDFPDPAFNAEVATVLVQAGASTEGLGAVKMTDAKRAQAMQVITAARGTGPAPSPGR